MKRRCEALRAAWLAYRAYLHLDDNGVTYSAFTRYGIPYVTLILGKGREAWRVSVFAVEEKGPKE